MAEYDLFGTYIVADSCFEREIVNAGAQDWSLSLEPDPSRRHWCDMAGRMNHTFFGEVGKERVARLGDAAPALHVLVEAPSPEIATNIQALIHSGCILGHPYPNEQPEPGSPYLVSGFPDVGGLMPGSFRYFRAVPIGCAAAARAWGDSGLVYGLLKYRLSLGLDWITPHSSLPIYGQIFNEKIPKYSYHVRAGFAVNAVFSAIEELGLEPRSSQSKPRWADAGQGTWNQDVLEDLVRRLSGRGVPGDFEVNWVYRGQPTEIERNMVPVLGRPQEYTCGVVRDRKMKITDALHYVSYMRNFFFGHRYTEISRDVGPYEVYNCQNLLRALLIFSLSVADEFKYTRGRGGQVATII